MRKFMDEVISPDALVGITNRRYGAFSDKKSR